MSLRENQAAAKQAFGFLGSLMNEQPCEAGRKSAIARVREFMIDERRENQAAAKQGERARKSGFVSL